MAFKTPLFVAMACGLTTIAPRLVRGDDYEPTDTHPPSDAGGLPTTEPTASESVWHDPKVSSGIGVGVDVGGGVTGFVGSRLRDTTSIGGMWSIRAALGTHTPLALELGYVGSASQINGQLGPAQATMMGRTFESSVRFTALPRAVWSPYVFAGLGWQRYTINDRSFELSDTGIRTADDMLVMPFGLGAAYRYHAFVTDVRGTFRATAGSNMVLDNPQTALETGQGTYAPMHSWDASLNVGYEF